MALKIERNMRDSLGPEKKYQLILCRTVRDTAQRL